MKIEYFFLAVMLFLVGCNTKLDELEFDEWTPVLAIPMVNSTISYDDIITELNHPEEVLLLEDGLIALNFKGELESLAASELIQVPNLSESNSIQIDGTSATVLNLGVVPVSIPIFQNVPLDLGPNVSIVSEIEFSSGELNVSLTRSQDEFVGSTITIDGLFDENNQPVTLNFSGNQAVGIQEVISLDLADYKLFPTFIPPDQSQINVTGELFIENNPDNSAQAGQLMEMTFDLSNMNFSHVIGDFGMMNLSIESDTILLDLFQDVEGGSFQLEESSIRFDIENSFGFPTLIDVNEVKSENLNTGVITPILFENVDLQGQDSQSSSPEVLSIIYDNSNSEISGLFTSAPSNVIVDFNALANPFGSPPPNDLNFLTDSSSLKVDVDVILPLVGSLNDVVVKDTIDSDFFLENREDIDSLELRIETINQFPIGSKIQITFLDSLNTSIDSLFQTETLIISPSMADSEGNVVNSSVATTYVTLDDETVILLNDTRKIEIKTVINSYQSSDDFNVRINNNQSLQVKLGAKIYGRLEL